MRFKRLAHKMEWIKVDILGENLGLNQGRGKLWNFSDALPPDSVGAGSDSRDLITNKCEILQ
jgi:hypothetical protein